jgi:hypothetical protein
MILINKVTPFANDSYQKDLFECLISNSDISFISNIIVFYTNTNIVLPKNNKVKLVVKNGYTDRDIIEYCKRTYNDDLFIFSNPFIKFNNSLSYLEKNLVKPVKINNDCFFFNKSIELKKDYAIDELISISDVNCKIKIEIKQQWTREIRDDVASSSIRLNTSSKSISVLERNTKRKKIYINRKIQNKNELPKIDVVIVSVNYNDFLAITLKNTTSILDVTVVTSPTDIICQELCRKFGAKCVITERMYENNATFNKGKAINEGIRSLKNPEWIILLDADIYLQSDFLDVLKSTELNYQNLVVCKRLILDNYDLFLEWLDNKNVGISERAKGFGFFHMFNIKKFPRNSKIFPEDSNDASFSDLTFRDMFKEKTELETSVTHLGQICKNWQGRKTNKFINSYKIDDILGKNSLMKSVLDGILFEKKDEIEYHKDIIDNDQFIIHVSSIYQSNEENNRRNLFAQSTWLNLYEESKIIPCMIYDNSLQKIKDLFNKGYELCINDNDIIMFTNSDICLTEDLYEEVVKSCNKYECTFSFRKDFDKLNRLMSKEEVIDRVYPGENGTPKGADLFAVTKSWWEKWRDYLPDDQVIGRPTWDWVLRIAMGKSIEGDSVFTKPFENQGLICETPNISYHETHKSYWEIPENLKDKDSIKNTKIAYSWMNEKSNYINFTGKYYFEKTYEELLN